MRILLYGINFAPELTGIGKYTGEMAAWLVRAGHEVRVVTAPPYYPDWAVHDGYSAARFRRTPSKGIRIWRCPVWVPARPGGLARLLHLASFALSSSVMMLRHVAWRPQVVWVVEPALVCAPAAWLTARLGGGRAWLHVQDFEVDAAFELGLLPPGRLRHWVQGAERWLMRRFDRVSSISGRMVERLEACGVEAGRALLFPNWVDLRRQGDLPRDNPLRAELGLQAGQVVALYSGNMGLKQGLEILADAARLLHDQPALVFVFCGGGAGRQALVDRCRGLGNVRFLPLQPARRLPALLAMADIHLLPQRADAADLVMPSKLTGMLGSARPVVATAEPDTELGRTVASCGLVVPPEVPELFAAAILRLLQDASLRERLGAAGRVHAERHLDINAVLRRFEAELRRVTGGDRRAVPRDEGRCPDGVPALQAGGGARDAG